MKFRFLFCFLFVTSILSAQKYATRSGKTSFIGSEETFEQIKAVNSVSTAIVDSSSGDIAILLFIGAFDFEISLMQEHFNENYMDCHQYPKAIFKGELKDFSKNKLTSDSSFDLDGTLTIKGIEKEIHTKVYLKEENNRLYVTTNFLVKPEDFDISIPSIVRDKIAKQIQISIAYELIEKK